MSKSRKRFALLGAAGYVAPKHMKAISETGNILVAAMDKHDSVGILDKYFPDCAFFVEFERFERFLEKLKRNGEGIDYLVVCTPNYLHDAHCRFGLRLGVDVICEKPLALNPWNIDALKLAEQVHKKQIFNIYQLRLHEELLSLKNNLSNSERHKVDLIYVSHRGQWYNHSWKADVSKSGGLGTNIGVHMFDLLHYLFGKLKAIKLLKMDNSSMEGTLSLEHADVTWYLSIKSPNSKKEPTRQLTIGGTQLDLNHGFEDLHTKSYSNILTNKGILIKHVEEGLLTCYKLRTLASAYSNES